MLSETVKRLFWADFLRHACTERAPIKVYCEGFCAKHSNSLAASRCAAGRRSAYRLSADFVLNDEVIAQPVRRRVRRAAGQQRRNR